MASVQEPEAEQLYSMHSFMTFSQSAVLSVLSQVVNILVHLPLIFLGKLRVVAEKEFKQFRQFFEILFFFFFAENEGVAVITNPTNKKKTILNDDLIIPLMSILAQNEPCVKYKSPKKNTTILKKQGGD